MHRLTYDELPVAEITLTKVELPREDKVNVWLSELNLTSKVAVIRKEEL
jgi:hypothetical protein